MIDRYVYMKVTILHEAHNFRRFTKEKAVADVNIKNRTLTHPKNRRKLFYYTTLTTTVVVVIVF